MTNAAYVYVQQNSSSEAQSQRARFKLIEGGKASTQTFVLKTQAAPEPLAPPVPTEESVRLSRPHPKHSGSVCFLAAAFIALAICVVSMISSNVISSRISDSIASVPSSEYVVTSGDSLWSIAENHPIQGHSASEVVTWIIEINNLDKGLIIPGQSLTVPSQNS